MLERRDGPQPLMPEPADSVQIKAVCAVAEYRDLA